MLDKRRGEERRGEERRGEERRGKERRGEETRGEETNKVFIERVVFSVHCLMCATHHCMHINTPNIKEHIEL